MNLYIPLAKSVMESSNQGNNRNASMISSVVFFGENIAIIDRELSFQKVQECNAIIAIATSLQVYSAFRLVRMAKERGVPVAILNMGETRADSLADLRIDEACNPLLSDVASYFEK